MRFFIFICLGLFSLTASASSFAGYPESRLHSYFHYDGPRLPDEFLGSDSAPRIGLYAGGGTWDTGEESLKKYFTAHSISYRTFQASDLLGGALDSSGVQLLVMPGGESWTYLSDLGANGAKAVLDFVNKGGGYIGICAGAFYATSNREGGPVTGPYGIGLLDGTAYDGTSLGTKPFIEGMMTWTIVTGDPLMADLNAQYNMYLLGGPAFHYSDTEAQAKGIQVLGRFPEINDPAMIVFNYGQGRVFLSAPHLEVEEDPISTKVAASSGIDPTWPILDRVAHYVLKDTDRP